MSKFSRASIATATVAALSMTPMAVSFADSSLGRLSSGSSFNSSSSGLNSLSSDPIPNGLSSGPSSPDGNVVTEVVTTTTTVTAEPAETPTVTVTETVQPSVTPTVTETSTVTETAEPSETPTVTETADPTTTPTVTETSTVTETAEPSETPTVTETAEPTTTPTVTTTVTTTEIATTTATSTVTETTETTEPEPVLPDRERLLNAVQGALTAKNINSTVTTDAETKAADGGSGTVGFADFVVDVPVLGDTNIAPYLGLDSKLLGGYDAYLSYESGGSLWTGYWAKAWVDGLFQEVSADELDSVIAGYETDPSSLSPVIDELDGTGETLDLSVADLSFDSPMDKENFEVAVKPSTDGESYYVVILFN
ncbi:hypothetical protein [Corynebacterium alimapuense]|nr:hypothetical protein [Corynebacterium alimapuense]